MKSRTLFVWLAFALLVSVSLLPMNSAVAQTYDFEQPTITKLTHPDSLEYIRLVARAEYPIQYADTAEVVLNPYPGLGILLPSLYPTKLLSCPFTPIQGYVLDTALVRGQDLTGAIDGSRAVVIATLTFRPECVDIEVGDPLDFQLLWRAVDYPLEDCLLRNYTVNSTFNLETDCCAFLKYEEFGGFAFDGIIAIGDSVWLDTAYFENIDQFDNDTFWVDLSGVSCVTGDTVWTPYDGKLEVNWCLLENGLPLCGDTLWLQYARWDPATDFETGPWDYVKRDSIACIRQVDNVRPEIQQGNIDSCRIVDYNYIDNDTLGGCGDFLRVYMRTVDSPPMDPFFGDLNGDHFGVQRTRHPDFMLDPACDSLDENFDIRYIAMLFEDIVAPGDTFPTNSDSLNLLSLENAWVSEDFFWPHGQMGGDPGTDNDLLWIDIPIDPERWDSLQLCIDEALAAGDTVYVFGLDDAGNTSDCPYPHDPDGLALSDDRDGANGCPACMDAYYPALVESEIYADPNECPRFSPYDSTDASILLNLPPDSIKWYLDKIPSMTGNDIIDRFEAVYLIGFDVRIEPDDDPDTPTGAVITRLDYYHPQMDTNFTPPGAETWIYEFEITPGDSGASFTWYGKDGTDSVDADLGILFDYCPWGMLVGITEARYMDRGGCNAIFGSDHDGSTDIGEGYTTLNVIHAVLDTCIPGVVEPPFGAGMLDIVNLPNGPDYGTITGTYLWLNGDPEPYLWFQARRFFTQGLIDPCLRESLSYHVRVDTVTILNPAGYTWPDSTVGYYSKEDSSAGVIWTDIDFYANSTDADTTQWSWGHWFGDNSALLDDGLYRLTLEIKDNAGMVYQDPVYLWINGVGPTFDSVKVTNTLAICEDHFYDGEEMCVWVRTDSTADSLIVDWSCIYNIDPFVDSTILTSVDYTVNGDFREWFTCLPVDITMIDDLDPSRNIYEVLPYTDTCKSYAGSGRWNIVISAFDSDGVMSQADPNHTCDRAILGPSRCPLILGNPELYYYDPDSLDDPNYVANFVVPGFDVFGPMPDWNAISPGSVDSVESYDAILNPANDVVQDSIWVRVLIDSMAVHRQEVVGLDTILTDTLVVQFFNPTLTRIRTVRKPLFIPDDTTLVGLTEWPDNTIFDGRLELAEGYNKEVLEFRYLWMGTWFVNAGADSQMLVEVTDRDTIIIRAYTIDGDSITASGYGLICDTVAVDLDVDNDNPEFIKSVPADNWTGILFGRHPDFGTTPTVLNLGWDGDCGFRFAEGDTFQIKVRADELVHYDAAAYPNYAGMDRDPGTGEWPITRNWQVSLVDTLTANLITWNSGADTVKVKLLSVEPDTVDPGSDMYYILTGRFENLPPATFIYDALLVIRGAWDQAGNPGRYNNPVFTDAFEEDSFEDTTFFLHLIPCDPWADGCPDVFGPDSILGWIAPEDTNVHIEATIIETCELTECSPGVKADSIYVIEGDFQQISDVPLPWVVPDSVGDWFIYNDGVNDLGWARVYYWTVRADSADLATIYCDGDFLEFTIRFNTWNIPDLNSMTFDNCVQVDVQEPIWTSYTVLDTNEVAITTCIDPEVPFWIKASYGDVQECTTGVNGHGTGVVDTLIWADFTILTQNAANDSVPPDSIDAFNNAWWLVSVDDTFYCLTSVDGIFRLLALHDSIGHHDRELYLKDTLTFCSDCIVPLVEGVTVYCDCDDYEADVDSDTSAWCQMDALDYISPESNVTIVVCFSDPDGDSSLGIDPMSIEADLSVIDPMLGWEAPTEVTVYNGDTLAIAKWLADDCSGGDDIQLYVSYNNGDTLFVPFRVCDNALNCDTDTVAIAIVDTLPPLVEFVYTIGDDSIRAYVTPGDDNIHIRAEITGYVNDLVAAPDLVWADLSRFWCDGTHKSWYDTVYADYVEYIDDNHYRAWWGWYPGPWAGHPEDYDLYGGVEYDTTSLPWDTLGAGLDLCSCVNPGSEGWYDSLFFFVTDPGCNEGVYFNIFEISGCDTMTPAIDSVSVIGNHCAWGWISSTPQDSGHIEVWAWMDTVFNALDDTIKIDSMQADLAQLNADYAWTAFDVNQNGGWPVYGDNPFPAPTRWEMEGNRLVAKWVGLTARDLACGERVMVAVKSVRQTGLGGSDGYYKDIEYGIAHVDITPPWIIDMRIYSDNQVSNAETTWVAPHYPLYIDICAVDTVCAALDPDYHLWPYQWPGAPDAIGHLGWDLTYDEATGGGPGPFIEFLCGGILDSLWDWDPADTVVTGNYPYSQILSGDATSDTICIRWIGTPNFTDSCEFVDADILMGCATAHIEDCLSNPAEPVTDSVWTDDNAPQFASAVPWGDYTYYTGFPGDPDYDGVDSVLVLRNSNYAMDWDSVLIVNVVVETNPGDTLISWLNTYIDFTGFMTSPIEFPDEIWYNVNGIGRDSIVWYVDLYDGSGPLFDTGILSNRYYYPLFLSDSLGNRSTLYCNDLDSVITFTIQNWNVPNPGMLLLCDSTTVASDTALVDTLNMALWNNEKISPDDEMENLYKVWYTSMDTAAWAWYSHSTRFFVFVEDTVLQGDGIDNDADGDVDELGEGVDFYTADMRINNYPQVGHVDSMNVEGVWINYLWFADNFSEGRYDVELFISDIYGHRDTLACGEMYALTFFEDETCPYGTDLGFWTVDDERVIIRKNGEMLAGDLDVSTLVGSDSIFVSAAFDSISFALFDPPIFNGARISPHAGSGVDVDTTDLVDDPATHINEDSTDWNDGAASTIRLLNPDGVEVPEFTQHFYRDLDFMDMLTLVDPTGTALDDEDDGLYTIDVTTLDRMGNSCAVQWYFTLDRGCPEITNARVTLPGSNDGVSDLLTSWDYVEIKADIEDEFDGVDHVEFEYAFDANRDGEVDAYTYWQTANVLAANGANIDEEYPFVAYWSIRNLPWSSEDTLGLPPVDPDSCVNTYFVRIRAYDLYGHECRDTFAVNITDDIAPLAYMVYPMQGDLVPCFHPEVDNDSILVLTAYDSVGGGYDPIPGDTFTTVGRWFDMAGGLFQYKFFNAPGTYVPGNTDPAAGWVTIQSGQADGDEQDTITYRAPDDSFHVRFDYSSLVSGQYNMRFLSFDVCNNFDILNTPVVTFRVECDTTAPVAYVCEPPEDACLTNYYCDSTGTEGEWVLIKSTTPIFRDVDSVAFYFVDSLSVPGLGIHTFIGGSAPAIVDPEFAMYAFARWNTDNLLSGYYWLYAVAYDEHGLFDTAPLWRRVYVDNTAPTVTECWIGDAADPTTSVNEGETFYLRAYAEDNMCGISAVWFQYLDKFSNWQTLPSGYTSNVVGFYGADLNIGANPDVTPSPTGYYELSVQVSDFGNSPLDSIRFRAYAVDNVDIGNNNIQGDRNRNCNLDRDLDCDEDICCMAIEILDEIPSGTNLWCFNHAWFECNLPQTFEEPTTPIIDYDVYSTCNYQNPLDTLLLVAMIDDYVEDEWLLHFKFWRSNSSPSWMPTDTMYVPNDTTYCMNPAVPHLGPIALQSTWDSIYVVWTDARRWLDSADAANGLTWSQWTFAAYVEDLTGNVEYVWDQNSCVFELVCIPQAPITHASYVTNDVANPGNRIRVTEEVPYTDFITDTIEVIYNRIAGGDDPEALVLFYTDEEAIQNCRGDILEPFNIQLWQDLDDTTLQRICPTYPLETFDFIHSGLNFDQYPPDGDMDGRYIVGLYFDNSYEPGTYNFSMLVNWPVWRYNGSEWGYTYFNEGDADLDGYLEIDTDSTRLDLVVRVVNVNEPQVVICTPYYGRTCIHNTVPLSANLVDNPMFTGELDTVWFQYYDDVSTMSWQPVVDPYSGISYDNDPSGNYVRFEFDERELPGMAGWYYEKYGDEPWYAERDLFPDVAVYIWAHDEFYPMTEVSDGFWRTDVYMATSYEVNCYDYSIVIDANDDNIWDYDQGNDRWIDDPRDACRDYYKEMLGRSEPEGMYPYSIVCLCPWMINFASTDFEDRSYNFRTVVGWHDEAGYHVIENPAPGDSIHVFFVDNEEAVATHDIEFDINYLAGGLCAPADTAYFVTDIQPIDGSYNLVVEDICAVIYQVGLTNNPFDDSSWVNVDTVWSNDDMGWTEAWPGYWVAYNPLADNVDNDGDGLVDETYDVMAGDQVGEENTQFWSRTIVIDQCGNTFMSNAEELWVDVSEPAACITRVGDVSPADNQVVIVPVNVPPDSARRLEIFAENTPHAPYFDPGVQAVFQYRTLQPFGSWTNIQPAIESNDTVWQDMNHNFTAVWDLYAYFVATGNDPEGWFQLRVIAIDTVDNDDICDNVVCQITVRLNDIQPANRVELYQITSEDSGYVAISCNDPDIYYIWDDPRYCLQAIFAPTNIDTGLASLTFQWANPPGSAVWHNIETIWDEIDNGLNGDTTECVWFQPPANLTGEQGFDLRIIVEDYNGNDTSDVNTLYIDMTPPEGVGTAAETIAFTGPCGDRCRFDLDDAMVTAIFQPDHQSGEIDVDDVWLDMERDDGLYYKTSIVMERQNDSTWTFDFDGDLCAYMSDYELDMGCYNFTVRFDDCIGNTGELAVTTDCGFGDTTLICIDCVPDPPACEEIDYISYSGWDCVDTALVSLTDEILDGTTEVGNQLVTVVGTMPVYTQYIREVWLFVESEEAGVDSMFVDDYGWTNTSLSEGAEFRLEWDLTEMVDDALVYPSGYYRVWVLAVDAICQIQTEVVYDFWVHVDNDEPIGWITMANGQTPNPDGRDVVEIRSGDGDPAWLWIEWSDALTPDDSTQAHNQVQLWAKNPTCPTEDVCLWHKLGEVPSPCNPHFVTLSELGVYTCGDSLDIVVLVDDRWGNGDLNDTARVVEAYNEGRFLDVYVGDTVPPSTQLWSIGTDGYPDQSDSYMFDQQNRIVNIPSNWPQGEHQDVYLHAFSMLGDESIARVYFEFSFDGITWFEIGMDEDPDTVGVCNFDEPTPWWCEYTGFDILWTHLWDISGLEGDIRVRVRGEDFCGNFEEWEEWTVSIDVAAPMSKVYAWLSDYAVPEVPCEEWPVEDQIGDDLERYSVLTLGACPEQTDYDAYGTIWYIKRADDHPLEPWSWCYLDDDSTGPFSADTVTLWDGDDDITCPEPQVGVWYDIAVLTTDQSGHVLTWTQFINHGEGTTWVEKWQWLIDNGYVKRFLVVDHIAPIAHSLMVTPDQTPDSSVFFITGDVMLSAVVSDPDVTAATWVVIAAGAESDPWTVIERIEGDSNDVFSPLEGHWNTELLNGVFHIGAIAEDYYGNRDTTGWNNGPTNMLTVNIDNERPWAHITDITRDGESVSYLERGAEHVVHIEAGDNFNHLRQVALFWRHVGGDGTWEPVAPPDMSWPWSFTFNIPTDWVAGWTYEFAAVAYDLVWLTDMTDGQGMPQVDWTMDVQDNEANIDLFTIGGINAETEPRVHGDNITLIVHSEENVDHVRFIYIDQFEVEHEIATLVDTVGVTTWILTGWDVTILDEGPGQICVIGSADQGGDLVTIATDCRNITIDHTLDWDLAEGIPGSDGLIGGYCGENPLEGDEPLDDLMVRFNFPPTDAGIDTIWFEWKWAADPDEDDYWYILALAVNDLGLTDWWSHAWNALSLECGTITLRARLSDDAIPESNEAFVIFADSVRVDNCAPDVEITNINGDVTPDGTEIPWGQVATITATANDVFGNGGNSMYDGDDGIANACFYYCWPCCGGEERTGSLWHLIGCDDTFPYQAALHTGDFDITDVTTIKVEVWDDAGNCNVDYKDVRIVDELPSRAWIVGYDIDNEPGCDDWLFAATDDCPTNYTSSVLFQYSEDGGETWITMGEDMLPVDFFMQFCNPYLGWHAWKIAFEHDFIAPNAVYRAVAIDNYDNYDWDAPWFQFADVTPAREGEVAVYSTDWVQVPYGGEDNRQWVFSTIEDYTEACLINGALVCVEPGVMGDGSVVAAGPLHPSTSPCILNNQDGTVTIFDVLEEDREGQLYTVMTTYEMDVHRVDDEGGSNGWLFAEDGQAEVYIPDDATDTGGTFWFQPSHDDDDINLLPVEQYFYSWLSGISGLYARGVSGGCGPENPIRIRLRFDPSLLPQDAEDWQVVAAYWTGYWWIEYGITYVMRDFENGIVDFQLDQRYFYDYCEEGARDGEGDYCGMESYWAVFLTEIRPIDQYVRIGNGEYCEWAADSTYFETDQEGNITRPVTTNCHPNFWVVTGEGEFTPTWEDGVQRIDVWLDGIWIVNDGITVYMEDDSGHACDEQLFIVSYDQISGIVSVEWNPYASDCPPWYGCLQPGLHTVQFYLDNIPTNETPFFVDVSGPMAMAEPEYINHDITLWADLIDEEAGIDTLSGVTVYLKNCSYYWDWEYYGYYVVTREAMDLEPIPGGYRASFTVQWPAIEYMFESTLDDCPHQLCVEWEFWNKVCLPNEDTEDYVYTIDMQAPTVVPISPVGAAIDDDGDGTANEDPIDCVNNDGDFWYSEWWGWQPRTDEDPVNYVADTVQCGQRPTIEGSVDDMESCCNGASGVELEQFAVVIDGVYYTVADTEIEGLNFHITQPGEDDLVFTMGGSASGEEADVLYTPGEHRVTVLAADRAGNIGTEENELISWTYFVECAGPTIEFAEHDCNNYFNPEAGSETALVSFIVTPIENAPIRPGDGIQYRFYTITGEDTSWSGWTVVDPGDGTEPVDETVDLTGAYETGMTGVGVEIKAMNIWWDPEGDLFNGLTQTMRTFWADNCGPVFYGFVPEDGAEFIRDQAIVVEAYFNDNCEGEGAVASRDRSTDPTRKDAASTIATAKDAQIVGDVSRDSRGLDDLSRRDGGTLDNGSGIVSGSAVMTIIWPDGSVFTYDDPEDAGVVEYDNTHIKVIVPPGAPAGDFTVNIRAEDCVGNIGADNWGFVVTSAPPAITFCPVENDCNGIPFWRPGLPLMLCADVHEVDGVNVTNDGIAVNVVRVYDCPEGVCEEVILRNATFNMEPQPDPENRDQTFHITSVPPYNLGDIVATDIRIEVTAANNFGVSSTRAQAWVVDDTAPCFTDFRPEDGASFPRDQVVLVEVSFSDNCVVDGLDSREGGAESGKQLGSRTQSSTPSVNVKLSRMDAGAQTVSRRGVGSDMRGILDEGGVSGILLSTFDMNIWSPRGENVGPATVEDYAELDQAHAKFILPADQVPGEYIVNVSVSDCIGNPASTSWSFDIESAGPAIDFCEVESDTTCHWENYWNPANLLYLCATVQEMDDVNTPRENIRVDVYRVFPCESGTCEELILSNAAFTFVGEQPNSTDRAQTFRIEGAYNFENDLVAERIRVQVTAVNALGIETIESMSWVVDGTPPSIEIVSPQPDAVIDGMSDVTISANFTDIVPDVVASVPGHRGGSEAVSMKVGPQRQTSKSAARGGRDLDDSSERSNLGAWRGTVNRGLDDLDGDSGIDPACVELLLVKGSDVQNLTGEAIITVGNIRWTGRLEDGEYTVILSVCDRVCNTNSINWDFTVSPPEAGITYEPPYVVTEMPHTFVMTAHGTAIDFTSLRLTIEGASEVEGGGFGAWTVIVDHAAVQWEGDSIWYMANFSLEGLDVLRLHLSANYLSGAPIPTGQQTYAVDVTPPEPDLGGQTFNYPNPFTPEDGCTKFHLPLEENSGTAYAEIKLYDFAGRYVTTIYEGVVGPADAPEWCGENDKGEMVANGVYIANVKVQGGGKTIDTIVKVAFKKEK